MLGRPTFIDFYISAHFYNFRPVYGISWAFIKGYIVLEDKKDLLIEMIMINPPLTIDF